VGTKLSTKELLQRLRHQMVCLTGLTAYDTAAPITEENAIKLDLSEAIALIDAHYPKFWIASNSDDIKAILEMVDEVFPEVQEKYGDVDKRPRHNFIIKNGKLILNIWTLKPNSDPLAVEIIFDESDQITQDVLRGIKGQVDYIFDPRD
jgi:hypothetical protein